MLSEYSIRPTSSLPKCNRIYLLLFVFIHIHSFSNKRILRMNIYFELSLLYWLKVDRNECVRRASVSMGCGMDGRVVVGTDRRQIADGWEDWRNDNTDVTSALPAGQEVTAHMPRLIGFVPNWANCSTTDTIDRIIGHKEETFQTKVSKCR